MTSERRSGPAAGSLIARLPKAELHLHLEGTVGPETLWRLARKHGSPLAARGPKTVESLYGTGDFGAFLRAFKTVCEHLRQPEDYEDITYEALQKLAAQNVRYTEMTISAGVMLWKGEDVESSFAGIEAGYQRARAEFGIRAAWIFDAVRQFGTAAALEVVRHAGRLRDRGVIGFGIGGDERRAPAEMFGEVFERARGAGLRLTAHAGETAGPESVWNALKILGAERIGHGFTASSDERLVSYLAEKEIPLEICLTSNLRTGCLSDLARHPLRRYLDRGIPVSLNSDDPALFGTDLNREYQRAGDELGCTEKELLRLAENSFRTSFLPPEESARYIASIREFASTGPGIRTSPENKTSLPR